MEGEHLVDKGTELAQEWGVCGQGQSAGPELVSCLKAQDTKPLRARVGL